MHRTLSGLGIISGESSESCGGEHVVVMRKNSSLQPCRIPCGWRLLHVSNVLPISSAVAVWLVARLQLIARAEQGFRQLHNFRLENFL